MKKGPDKYERFLTGHMTARRLCAEIGFHDLANQLVDVFWGLQNAHDKPVNLEAKALTLGVIRAYQQGKMGKGNITEAGLADLLGLSRQEIKELDNLRMAAAPDPLDQVKDFVQVKRNLRLVNEL